MPAAPTSAPSPDTANQAEQPIGARAAGIWVTALALVTFTLALVLSHQLFPYYSVDLDDVAYVSQAKGIDQGKLTLPAKTQAEFFKPYLTGIRGDRIVYIYQPAWPAVLAASQAVFGTMRVALGLIAAATVLAFFLFAQELFGDRRLSLVAATALALSPLFVLQSATFLAYGFGVLLDVLFGWLLLRGLRAGSASSFALAGLAIGASFFHRPFDAILFALPFVVFAVVTRRHERRVLARAAAWLLVGAAPALVLTAAVNWSIMGSPLRFPVTVAGPYSQFGFGPRRAFATRTGQLAKSEYFGLWQSIQTLWANLFELPRWIFGGVIALGIAAWGVVRSRVTAKEWLLIGLVAIYPVGYLFWWGSYNATKLYRITYWVGPFYYYPMLLGLMLLAAKGLLPLLRHRRGIVASAVAVMVLVTATGINRAVQFDRYSTRFRRKELALFRAVPRHDALVFLQEPQLLAPYPSLMNEPDLSNSVLYALDRSDKNLALIDRHPKRHTFAMSREFRFDADIFKRPPRKVLRELEIEAMSALSRSMRIRNPLPKPYVIAYARVGDRLETQVLDRTSDKGKAYDVRWTIAARPEDLHGVPPAESMVVVPTRSPSHIALGVGFSPTPDLRDADRFEYRYSFETTADAQLRVLLPPTSWRRYVFLNDKSATVAEDIRRVLSESR